MNMILFEPKEVSDNQTVTLNDNRADHIRTVLKPGKGDNLRVGIINGPKGTAVVMALDERKVKLQCKFDPAPPPRPPVDILLALPRPKVMRRLWAPLASLGVGQIIVTNAWKVESNYFDTHILQPESYRPALIEGLAQAQDTLVPAVTIHQRFKAFVEVDLEGLFPNGLRLMTDPDSTERITRVCAASKAERILVAIGPEGGWTPYEKDLLVRHGFVLAGMGSRILRTDTACVALLALVYDALAGMDRQDVRKVKPVAARKKRPDPQPLDTRFTRARSSFHRRTPPDKSISSR